jgi:hypothetical protein
MCIIYIVDLLARPLIYLPLIHLLDTLNCSVQTNIRISFV